MEQGVKGRNVEGLRGEVGEGVSHKTWYEINNGGMTVIDEDIFILHVYFYSYLMACRHFSLRWKVNGFKLFII